MIPNDGWIWIWNDGFWPSSMDHQPIRDWNGCILCCQTSITKKQAIEKPTRFNQNNFPLSIKGLVLPILYFCNLFNYVSALQGFEKSKKYVCYNSIFLSECNIEYHHNRKTNHQTDRS